MKLNGQNQNINEQQRATNIILKTIGNTRPELVDAGSVQERQAIFENAQIGISHTYQTRTTIERTKLNLGPHANEFFYSLGECTQAVGQDYIFNCGIKEDIDQDPEEAFITLANEYVNFDFYSLGAQSDMELSQSVDIVRRMQSMRDIDLIAEEYSKATGYQPDPEVVQAIKDTYEENKRIIEGCAAKIEYLSSELYIHLGDDINVLDHLENSVFGLAVKGAYRDPAVVEEVMNAKAYAESSLTIMGSLADQRKAEDPLPVKPEFNLVVDITGKDYATEGGAISTRLKLAFDAPDGSKTVGYFTENNDYDPLKDYMDGLKRIGEKFPGYKEITDGIAEIGDERLGTYASKAIPIDMDAVEAVRDNMNPESPSYMPELAESVWNKLVDIGYFEQESYDELKARPDFPQFTYELMNVIIPNANKLDTLQGLGIMKGDNANRRNKAMSEVADLLGQPQLLARSVNMTVIKGKQRLQGTFMYNAAGIDFAEADPVNTPELGRREVEVSPQALNQINNLMILDYICGNPDRHYGNLTYTFDFSHPSKVIITGVQGIDNDTSFVNKTDTVAKQMTALREITVMSKDMADAITAVTPEELDVIMRRATINQTEREAALFRLQKLQEAIASGAVKRVNDDYWQGKTLEDLGDGHRMNEDTAHDIATYIDYWNETKRHEEVERKPVRTIEAGVNQTGNAKFHMEIQAQQLKGIRENLKQHDPALHFNRPKYRSMFKALDKAIELADRYARLEGQPSDMQFNKLADAYEALGIAARNYVAAHQGPRTHEFGKLRVDVAENLQILADDYRHAAQEDTLKVFQEAMNAMKENIRKNGAPREEAPADKLVKGRTVYGSLNVTQAQKDEIQTQGISEYLIFDQRPDGTYDMRTALPKEGIKNGKTYQIRECVNIICKALANKILTDDGSIDLVAAENASENGAANPYTCRNYLATLDIPEDKRNQVMEFFDEFGDVAFRYMRGLAETTGINLARYKTIMAKTIAEPDPKKKAAMGKIVGESYQDYVNHIKSIRELAKIDPATETRILVDLDCENSAIVNMLLREAVDNKALLENKTPINFEDKRILMGEGGNDVNRGQITAFDEHYVFGGNITIDGKTMFMSFETTAAPAGRFLFKPEVGATGIGLYENEDEMRYHHHWNNNLQYENPEAMKLLRAAKYKQEGTATYGEPAMLQAKAFARTTSHNIAELIKRLDDPSVNAGNNRRTSPNFEAMNAAVRRYNETRDIADLEAIRQTAKKYLLGKIPQDGSKKVEDYSSYTRNRIQVAADILEFAAASKSPDLLKANLNKHARQAHYDLTQLIQSGNAENSAENAKKDLATMLACKELTTKVDKLLQSPDISNANLDLLTNSKMIEGLSKAIMGSPAFTAAINTIGKQGIEKIVKQGNTNNSPEFAKLDDAFTAAGRDMSLNAKAPKAEEKEQVKNAEANKVLGQ